MVLPLLLLGGGSAALIGGLLKSSGVELDGEDVGEGLASAFEVVFDALPPLLASFSVGVVDGVAASTVAVREALEGRETAFIQGTTMLLIGWATIRTMKTLTGGFRN